MTSRDFKEMKISHRIFPVIMKIIVSENSRLNSRCGYEKNIFKYATICNLFKFLRVFIIFS